MAFIISALTAGTVTVGTSGAAAGTATAITTTTGLSAGAAAAIDAGLIAAATAGYSAYSAGQQQKANMEYNAAVQKNQALAEQAQARHQAGLIAERGRKLRAAQRTQYAKAGVGLAGTPLLVLGETTSDIYREILMTGYGGQRRAGYYRAQSGLSLMQGRDYGRAGVLAAGGALLSGGAQAAYQYKTLRR